MGKRFLFLLIVVLVAFPIFSDLKTDAEGFIDFSVTLETINRAVKSGRTDVIPKDKLLIIDGAISAIEIINPEAETFTAELTMVDGKWYGMEDVRMFSCVIQVSGQAFAKRIPVRRSRNPNPDEIEANDHVVVVARYLGIGTDLLGAEVPVLEGFEIRTID